MSDSIPYNQFTAATLLLRKQLLIDAQQAFLAIAHNYPNHELADDAIYNAGLCHFHLNNFGQAISLFRALIETYPQATINAGFDGEEFGSTAAKAHYAVINCYLGLGQFDMAKEEAEKLMNYPDAGIITQAGEKRSFYDLALKSLEVYHNAQQ